MKQAAAGIEGEIQTCIEKGTPIQKGEKLRQFLSMQVLNTTLRQFLDDNSLSNTITDGKNWESFQRLLVDIVSEQAIIAPSKRIAQFIYDESGNGLIDFEIKPPQFKRYKFSQ
jgi:hypothetical protein